MARRTRKQAASGLPPPDSPKVPATPNNTSVSTPTTSETDTVDAVVSAVTKALKKMAKNQRAEKRHLVRWNDGMDKQLLLGIQYCCNAIGLNIPWTDVGRLMGEHVTGGAIVQHMAKMRTRMVEQGLEVPPPLKRGGGTARINTTSTTFAPKVKATSSKSGTAKPKTAKPKINNSAPAKRKKGKKATPASDEDEDDDWKDDDSDADADYGKPRAKRARLEAKGAAKGKAAAGSEDEDDGDVAQPEVVGAGEAWLELEDDDGEGETKADKSQDIKEEEVEGLAYMNQPQRFTSIYDDVNAEFDAEIAVSNNVAAVPYQLQTTFPEYSSTASSSNFNQTPAGTSAGADFSNGYFDSLNQTPAGTLAGADFSNGYSNNGAAQFNAGSAGVGNLYDDGMDFLRTTNADPFFGAGVASNDLFTGGYMNAGNFDGDFVPGDYLGGGNAGGNFGTGNNQNFSNTDYFGS